MLQLRKPSGRYLMPSKGTTNQRDYGADHQRIREKYKPLVASGEAICPKCGRKIAPDAEWHLGHTDDRKGRTGPEHAYCNTSAAGKKKARLAREAKAARTNGADTSRQW